MMGIWTLHVPFLDTHSREAADTGVLSLKMNGASTLGALIYNEYSFCQRNQKKQSVWEQNMSYFYALYAIG